MSFISTSSPVSPVTPVFSQHELRRALGAFVTGVTVITTLDETGRPIGLTANSFASVSLEPPLILWSQSRTAPSYPVFCNASRFAVSILAAHQDDISDRFARGGADKFQGVAVRAGLGGVPLIEGAAATLECSLAAAYEGGDHTVFLGRVERIEQRDMESLAYAHGRYRLTTELVREAA